MRHKFYYSENTALVDRIKNKINEKFFRVHYCRLLAHEVINYLCGKQETFLHEPIQYSGQDFIKKIAPHSLFDPASEGNLFLLELGKGYHTLVIEKIKQNDELEFIIYHSWFSLFSLEWWLGNDNAPHRISGAPQELREQYGRAKKLSIDEIGEFISNITEFTEIGVPITIGIAGIYNAPTGNSTLSHSKNLAVLQKL